MNDTFGAWRRQVARSLARALKPRGILVAEEFPAATCHPWEGKRRVAVRIASMELPGGTRLVKVVLQLEILSPKGDPGGCYEVFEALSDELGQGGYGVSRLSCGEVNYREDLDCFSSCARAEVAGMLVPGGSPQAFQRLVVRAEEGIA